MDNTTVDATDKNTSYSVVLMMKDEATGWVTETIKAFWSDEIEIVKLKSECQ